MTKAFIDAYHDDPEFGHQFLTDGIGVAGFETNVRRVWPLCRDQRLWSPPLQKIGR
jgi:hypothetical protein